MTRRILIAILLSVWLMMLATGVTAYFVTRSILLHELDARLVARAAALPEVNGMPGATPDSADRYLIRGEHGQVLRRADPAVPQQTPNVIAAQFARLGDGRSYRSVTVEFRPNDSSPDRQAVTVVYSGPAETFDRVLRRLALALAGLGVVGSIGAAAVAAATSRAALKPLEDVSQVIGEIDEHNLSRRVDTAKLPEELQSVGGRLNGMLARIDGYFQQRRRFLADASHELRTPVAALVTTLEVNLSAQQADAPRMRRALEYCLHDARLLSDLVSRLTTQVRSELGAEQHQWRDTDLSELLHECLAVAAGLALGKAVRVSSDVPPGLRIRTRPDLLRRACLNLIGNAVAYNVQGGELVLTCEPAGRDVRITVRDTGIGIAADELPHVFTPFFRADPSRGTDDGHLGLGMYQVQGDVAAINGTCHIDSAVGVGTTVVIALNACRLSPEIDGDRQNGEPTTEGERPAERFS